MTFCLVIEVNAFKSLLNVGHGMPIHKKERSKKIILPHSTGCKQMVLRDLPHKIVSLISQSMYGQNRRIPTNSIGIPVYE